MRARLATPVDESHEQVAITKQRIQRGEQAPGGVPVERSRADLLPEFTQRLRDFLRIGGVCEIRRHVAQRRGQRGEVGAQLIRREGGRRRGLRRARQLRHDDCNESALAQREACRA